MMEWKQFGKDFKNFGLDYGNPDFVKYAGSYGTIGHRVKSTDQLTEFLETSINCDGVHIREAPVDYSENKQDLIEEFKSKSCIVP